MLEYRDGHFGEPGPLGEALQEAWEQFQKGKDIKAVHVGTLKQLDGVKERKILEDRLDALEARLKELEPTKSEVLVIPTASQIKEILLSGGDR